MSKRWFFGAAYDRAYWEQAILDLVMCNEADLIRVLKVKEPFGSSDHNMIEFTMQFEREMLESDATVFPLNKGKYKDMREEMPKS